MWKWTLPSLNVTALRCINNIASTATKLNIHSSPIKVYYYTKKKKKWKKKWKKTKITRSSESRWILYVSIRIHRTQISYIISLRIVNFMGKLQFLSTKIYDRHIRSRLLALPCRSLAIKTEWNRVTCFQRALNCQRNDIIFATILLKLKRKNYR